MVPTFIKPQKQIICSVLGATGKGYWPVPFGDEDISWEGGSSPRYTEWEVTISISSPQRHGYPYSTVPYQYSGIDVNMGGFVARASRGMIYRVKEVLSKTEDKVVAIIEDVYRVNSFSFPTSISVNPGLEFYVYFEVNNDFKAEVNSNEISASIPSAISQYIPTYLDKISFTKNPILCCNEEMGIGDVVAIHEGKYVKASKPHFNKIVGKVEMSTGVENEYVINPVYVYTKIDTHIGSIGDIIYLSDDGSSLTTEPTMKPMYLKVLDSIPNVSISTAIENAYIPTGSHVRFNEHEFIFNSDTSLPEFIDIFNLRSLPYLTAEQAKTPYTISNGSNYEFGILGIMDLPSVISINGTEVTISTTTAGQAQYSMEVAIGADIVSDITSANVPNITASFSTSTGRISLTNEAGGDIIIQNISGGVFASDTGNSGTGFKETNIAPEGNVLVKIVHSLGKEIIVRDLGIGTFTDASGITSSDNGMIPRGIYYGSVVRTGTNYVVPTIADMDMVSAYIGDGVHVEDGGNGEWVEKKYTPDGWVTIATQDSARTDSDTLSIYVDNTQTGAVYIGTVSGNSRISNITVVVIEAFDDDTMTVNVGDSNNNSSLLDNAYIDLLNTATYSNSPSNVYEEETEIYVYINEHSSSMGRFKVVISYQ